MFLERERDPAPKKYMDVIHEPTEEKTSDPNKVIIPQAAKHAGSIIRESEDSMFSVNTLDYPAQAYNDPMDQVEDLIDKYVSSTSTVAEKSSARREACWIIDTVKKSQDPNDIDRLKRILSCGN
ncbi:hypothetical protein TetV_470 [Tetraselmis virus 1]|uniref:Uncharacterized protein n=1 Tax=Tetraselmis virus 1 TaxID=2060617 RepID=A0A2P0VNU1_9VIRU|nr:hypothetical protein QJ968_gp584 [Tetraselmis virus 1]AUF82552.1 hypothetical protein TetV_470 [Tetraselmis virus 1]